MAHRRRRPVIALLVVALVAAGPATPLLAQDGPPSGRYVDDDRTEGERWFEELAALGVVSGCNPPADTRICPDRPVRRAEAAKMVVELGLGTGLMDPSGAMVEDPFVDDDRALGGGAEAYVARLVGMGAIHGCDPPANTRFCPSDPVSRGEASKIIVGAFGLEPDRAVDPWPDVSGRYYEESAGIARSLGMWGRRATFDGNQAVDRAELARALLVAAGREVCRADPFGPERVAELARRYPGQSLTAHVYDARTGCHYRLNPDNRQRTASVFKVMVMAGTLLEAQRSEREVTEAEMRQLRPMIAESANPPVRVLWASFGGAPWFRRQADRFGLDDTVARGDDGTAWGLTTTSAADQVDLLRQVLLGEWGPLDAASRTVALDLMTSVTPSQTWGVPAGVPEGWTVAQKNGFAGITINTVGWVDEPGPSRGWVTAILSQGWPSHDAGIEAVERVNRWVAAAMTG